MTLRWTYLSAPRALLPLRLFVLAALLIAACRMPFAIAQEDRETYCANLATVTEYAAEQRDGGASLSEILAEIDELTDEGSGERERFADAVRFVFSIDSSIAPDRLAWLVYHRCMTSIAT